MLKFIEFEGEKYPEWESQGWASKFAFPFAIKVCKGIGVDIGYSRPEWKLPLAKGIEIGDMLPGKETQDYVFSSHCLEHCDSWVETLSEWISLIKSGGILFLYLPDYSQKYWRPWNNRKHKHVMVPEVLRDFLNENGMKNVMVSGVDFNHSFMIIAEKI